MISFRVTTAWFASLICIATQMVLAEPDAPLDETHGLLFHNGNVLSGHLIDIPDPATLTFASEGVPEPIEIDIEALKTFSRTDGFPDRVISYASLVTLSDGSVLPCDIGDTIEGKLELRSSYASDIAVPLDELQALSISPWKGDLIYRGPFSREGWIELTATESTPPHSIIAPAEEGVPLRRNWDFIGAGFNTHSTVPIATTLALTDSIELAFQLDWEQQLRCVIAFHCNYSVPAAPNAEKAKKQLSHRERVRIGDRNSWPYFFGSGYAITFQGRYVTLFRLGFNEDGIATVTRVTSQSLPQDFMQRRQAQFTIRSDRDQHHLALFIDDAFILQWYPQRGDEVPELNSAHKGIGLASTQNNGSLRLSNMTVSSWNGMLDSAASLVSPELDVALMSNGIDRTGGELMAINDGVIEFKTAYGLFSLTLDQVSEIQRARRIGVDGPTLADEIVRITLDAHGIIYGQLVGGSRETIVVENSLLGLLEIPLSHVMSIDFTPDDPALVRWQRQ